jgi:carbamoyltransferase
LNILGYASLNHDAAIALMSDGSVVAAIESEKITRAKHEVNTLPEAALNAVLKFTGRALSDIDAIAVNYAAGPLSNRFYIPHILGMLRARSFDLGVILSDAIISGAHHPRLFARLAESSVPPIVRVKHHRAHLAATYLASDWDDAAVAIIDASGELECSTLWHCSGREVKKLLSMDLPADSLGSVYMLSTRHLGFKMLGDEYKVMGLAPYGAPNPVFRSFFENLIHLEEGGRYRVNARLLGRVCDGGWFFPDRTRALIGPSRRPDEALSEVHADFAFELQRRLEEAILHMVQFLRRTTGCRRLCMGGGVALNCVANGRILRDSGFDEVFIPPAPHDAGTALGAALHHHYYDLKGDRPPPMTSAYLGPLFTNADVQGELVRSGQVFERVSDPAAAAAAAIAEGLVIGWCQGRTEFGPRALGNRSILADPRRIEMKGLVNELVKEREAFRPFAPAVLESEAANWFMTIRRSPWMLFVDSVREEVRTKIPAVVHVDGSARPQTVRREDNPAFHALLTAFHRITGVPMVLNTSFNVAGEPIVNTPTEAVRCFQTSGLDALFLGPFVLTKPRVRWRPPPLTRTVQCEEEPACAS